MRQKSRLHLNEPSFPASVRSLAKRQAELEEELAHLRREYHQQEGTRQTPPIDAGSSSWGSVSDGEGERARGERREARGEWRVASGERRGRVASGERQRRGERREASKTSSFPAPFRLQSSLFVAQADGGKPLPTASHCGLTAIHCPLPHSPTAPITSHDYFIRITSPVSSHHAPLSVDRFC